MQLPWRTMYISIHVLSIYISFLYFKWWVHENKYCESARVITSSKYVFSIYFPYLLVSNNIILHLHLYPWKHGYGSLFDICLWNDMYNQVRFERTWWWLFLSVSCGGCSWEYLVGVVPDNTWWGLYLAVPGGGCSWVYLVGIVPERTFWGVVHEHTWWGLFLSVPGVSCSWTYLVRVILESNDKSIPICCPDHKALLYFVRIPRHGFILSGFQGAVIFCPDPKARLYFVRITRYGLDFQQHISRSLLVYSMIRCES